MTHSRNKGKRGELEWAAYLTELGYEARRGQQYRGGPASPDIIGGIPGTHAEVKRVERLDIRAAIHQAVVDAGDAIPYVAHRRNREEWLITLRAADMIRFMEALNQTREA